MRKVFGSILALVLSVSVIAPAKADVQVIVILATQKAYVAVNGRPTYFWDVATARHGFVTPEGRFSVTELDEDHVSDEFGPDWCQNKKGRRHRCGAPMHYSIFFAGGKAIHAGPIYERSHGCVHLEYKNAATLFALVERYGKHKTTITIQ